jgi:hypothetical protein
MIQAMGVFLSNFRGLCYLGSKWIDRKDNITADSFQCCLDRLWNDAALSDAETAKIMPLFYCEVMLTSSFHSFIPP